MRIFIAVQHSKDPRHFYGGLWAANFYPALRELGHEIVESQTDLLPCSRFMGIPNEFTPEELECRAHTTQCILDDIRLAMRRGRIDLLLSYFYNSHFDPAGFDELRKLNVPSVNFYCNSIYQFDNVAAIASKVDYSWHAERDARHLYLAVGANPVWVQMGADPAVYRPLHGIQRRAEACFVGQRYCDRDRWLTALVRENVPVAIYGTGWGTDEARPEGQPAGSYFGRPTPAPGSALSYTHTVARRLRRDGLWRGAKRIWSQARMRTRSRGLRKLLRPYAKGRADNVAEVFSLYELCLNFSNVWSDGEPGSALIPHVRLRDFEAPMSRSALLTGYSDELAEFYRLGREIDTYQSEEELVDKTRYYLSHPQAAETLRDAGFRRARADHTWVCRFSQLFERIGLGNGAVRRSNSTTTSSPRVAE